MILHFSRFCTVAAASVQDNQTKAVVTPTAQGNRLDYLPAAKAQVNGDTLSFIGTGYPTVELISGENYQLNS